MASPESTIDGQETKQMVPHEESRSEAAQLRRLSEEIHQLVDEYRTSDEQPPFSAAEKVAVACVCICTEQPSANKSGILGWILQNLKYYRDLALRQYVITQCSEEDEPVPTPTAVITGFREAFNRWYLPVIPADGEVEDSVVYTRESDDEIEIVIPAGAARIFLEPWLGKARKRTFPFLKLPPELRNCVYEMAISFPKDSGVIHLREPRTYRQGDKRAPDVYLLNRSEDSYARDPDDVGD